MHKQTEESIFQNVMSPIRKAFDKLDINENSVLKVYKDILDDPDVSPATRLQAVNLFWKWLGIASPEKIETTQLHKITVNKKNIKKNKKG